MAHETAFAWHNNGMVSSSLLALGLFCAGSALAMVLGENQWAKDHAWLIPVLWTSAGILLVASIASTRWFRKFFISQEAITQEAIDQKLEGIDNSATAVGSVGNIGNATHVEIGTRTTHVHQAPQLLANPPRVAFLGHGPIQDSHGIGQAGFYLVNDGEVAYRFMIDPFEIEPSVWAMSKEVSRIEARGESFALVWLDGYSQHDPGKWDLLGAMARASDVRDRGRMMRLTYSLPVRAVYRGADECWHRMTTVLDYVPSRRSIEFRAPDYEKCGMTRPPEISVPLAQPPSAGPWLSIGGTGNVKAPAEMTAYIVAVRNGELSLPTTATNVMAEIEYGHEGTNPLAAGGVFLVGERGNYSVVGTTNLAMEQTAKLVLFVGHGQDYFIPKLVSGSLELGEKLQAGVWTAFVRLSGDNCPMKVFTVKSQIVCDAFSFHII